MDEIIQRAIEIARSKRMQASQPPEFPEADSGAPLAEQLGFKVDPSTGEYDTPNRTTPEYIAENAKQKAVLDSPGNQAMSGAVFSGIAKAGFELNDFAHEIQGDPVKPEDRSQFRKDVEAYDQRVRDLTPIAGVTSGAAQFVTGMLGVGKVMAPIKALQNVRQAGKLGAIAYEAGKGAIANAIVTDPHEARLSNLIQEYPALSNPINEYLAADPDDSYVEGRLKNALEGVGMDLALTGVFAGVMRAFRFAKNGDQEAARAALTEIDTPQSMEIVKDAETPKPRIRVKAGSEVVPPVQAANPEVPLTPEGKPRVRVKAGSERVEPEVAPAADEVIPLRGAEGSDLGADVTTTPVKSEASDLPKADAVKPVETADVPEVDMAKILKGTDDDLTALEKAGSYSEAVMQGHKFADGGSIPWQKLNTPEDVKTLIDNAVPVFKPELDAMKGGDVLKDASVDRAVRQVARYFEEDPSAVFGELAKAGDAAKDMVRQMEAGYLISNKMFLDTFDVIRKIKGGNLVDFHGDKAAAVMEAKKRLSLAIQAFGEAQSIKSNAARTMRRMQGGFKVAPETLSKIDTMDEATFVDLLYSTEGDPTKLREIAKPRFWNMVTDEALFQMRNGLLWNYKTHLVNLTGNALMMVARPLERQIGSVFVKGGSAIRKQASKEYYYTVASLTDGLKAALEAFDRGDSILAPHATEWLETANHTAHRPLNLKEAKTAADLFENLWKANLFRVGTGLPTRALGMQDEFFKTVRYRAAIQADAMTRAEEMGLRGDQLRDYLEQRLAGAFDAEGRATNKAALQEAQIATFSQDLLSPSWGSSLQALRKNHPTLGFVLPFVKTPVNALRMAVKYTPGLNFAQREYRQMIRGEMGPEAQAQAYGQMALGSLILSSSTLLSLSGRISGAGPSDLKQRQELEATGWRPYSLKIEGEDGTITYVPLSRLDPTGFVLSVGADLGEIYKVGEDGGAYTDAIAAAAIAISKNLGERAFLQNIRQAIDAAWAPDANLTRFAGNITGSMIPASSALEAYGNRDPYLREARTYIDNLKKRLPGFSETLPPKRDVFGEPIWKQTGLSTTSSLDPVEAEHSRLILETGKGLNLPDPTRNGVDLRDMTLSNGRNAYDLFQEYAANPPSGKSMREALKETIGAQDYGLLVDGDAGTPGTKLWAMSGVVSDYRKAGFQRLLHEFPELGRAINQQRVKALAGVHDNKAKRDGSGMTGEEFLKRIGF